MNMIKYDHTASIVECVSSLRRSGSKLDEDPIMLSQSVLDVVGNMAKKGEIVPCKLSHVYDLWLSDMLHSWEWTSDQEREFYQIEWRFANIANLLRYD